MIRAVVALPLLRRVALVIEGGLTVRLAGVPFRVELRVNPDQQVLTVRPGTRS